MFSKGQSGNPNGRPKGAATKTKKEIRTLFNIILNGEMDKLTEALDYLREYNPDKYVNTVIRLTELVYPNGFHEENEEKENYTIVWGEIRKNDIN